MGGDFPLFAGRPVGAPPRLDDAVSHRDGPGHDLTVRIDRSAEAAPTGTCYDAATPAGPLRVEVAQARARHAADAALALLRADDLLWALQRWSGLPLSWRWVEGAPADLVASHLRMSWQLPADHDATRPPIGQTCAPTGGEAGTLHMPWAMLRALPAPEDGLLTKCLSWPAVDAVLSMAALQLDEVELQQLEPGGAVLLRASSTRPWHGRLRAQAEPAGMGVPVDLSCITSPMLASPEPLPPAPANPAHIGCEVRLTLPAPLPPATLAGWHAGQALAAGEKASLWRTTSPRGPATCLAAGHLMPWGDGWALALDMLCDAAVAATLAR